jgi:hypothetical protein
MTSPDGVRATTRVTARTAWTVRDPPGSPPPRRPRTGRAGAPLGRSPAGSPGTGRIARRRLDHLGPAQGRRTESGRSAPPDGVRATARRPRIAWDDRPMTCRTKSRRNPLDAVRPDRQAPPGLSGAGGPCPCRAAPALGAPDRVRAEPPGQRPGDHPGTAWSPDRAGPPVTRRAAPTLGAPDAVRVTARCPRTAWDEWPVARRTESGRITRRRLDHLAPAQDRRTEPSPDGVRGDHPGGAWIGRGPAPGRRTHPEAPRRGGGVGRNPDVCVTPEAAAWGS